MSDTVSKNKTALEYIKDSMPNTTVRGCADVKLKLSSKPHLASSENDIDDFTADIDMDVTFKSEHFVLDMLVSVGVSDDYILDRRIEDLIDLNLHSCSDSSVLVSLGIETLAGYGFFLTPLSDEFCKAANKVVYSDNPRASMEVGAQYGLYYDTMNQSTQSLLISVAKEFNAFLQDDYADDGNVYSSFEEKVKHSLQHAANQFNKMIDRTSF